MITGRKKRQNDFGLHGKSCVSLTVVWIVHIGYDITNFIPQCWAEGSQFSHEQRLCDEHYKSVMVHKTTAQLCIRRDILRPIRNNRYGKQNVKLSNFCTLP